MSVWSQVKVVDMGTHALVSICRNACVALNVGLIPKTYAKGDFDFFPWCLLALAEKTLDIRSTFSVSWTLLFSKFI